MDNPEILSFEIKNGFNKNRLIAGIDEVGRGPLCGSVIAASVCFSPKHFDYSLWKEINDSKKLSAIKREKIFDKLYKASKNNEVYIGVGESTVEEIDKINILQATFLAMTRSAMSLSIIPEYFLIDGNKTPPSFPYESEAIIKGDSKSLSIAAASIVAKVIRDNKMKELAKEFPEYKWEKNAGYGTKEHLFALKKYGITKYHRKSFAPIKNMI